MCLPCWGRRTFPTIFVWIRRFCHCHKSCLVMIRHVNENHFFGCYHKSSWIHVCFLTILEEITLFHEAAMYSNAVAKAVFSWNNSEMLKCQGNIFVNKMSTSAHAVKIVNYAFRFWLKCIENRSRSEVRFCFDDELFRSSYVLNQHFDNLRNYWKCKTISAMNLSFLQNSYSLIRALYHIISCNSDIVIFIISQMVEDFFTNCSRNLHSISLKLKAILRWLLLIRLVGSVRLDRLVLI